MNDDINVLKQILDGSNQMIHVSDANTLTMLYANAPATASSGHNGEPYEGRKCYEYFMGQDMPCPFCPLHEMRNNTSHETEIDNGHAIYAIKITPIDWQGKRAFVEYARDITNIRRSENLYRRETEAILHSIENAKSVFHVDIDADKVLTYSLAQGNYGNVSKMTASQLLYNGTRFIPKAEDKEKFMKMFSKENFHETYAKGKMTVSMDTEWTLDSKEVRDARFTAQMLLNPINSHLECVLFSLDTTEEMKLKREMDITNKLNEALVCEFGTIFVLNLDDGTMRIRKMTESQNAKKLNLPEVLPFDHFFKLYAENFILEEYRDDVLNQINTANLRARIDKGEYNISLRYKVKPNANGEENFEAVVLPVSMEDHYHLVVGCKCIDKLIAREEHDKKILKESREQAEEANKAKTSFLFNMSHDIRTPMNAIMGFTNLLEKHQDNPELRQDYLNKIADSSNILLSIINNVLEMARIEKGTIELDESSWSVDKFAESVYTLFDDMMVQKKLEFTHNINVEHNFVMCDPTKLREVFFNIISNAYKYTPIGGKIHMQVDEVPSGREGYAKFRTTITDNGRGMSEEFLPHIFEEFTREHNTTQGKVQGTGLGMPIVKRLVEIMNGTIEVKSKLGEGTSVIVSIPHKITENADFNSQYIIEAEPKALKGKRILLAEDNDINAEIAIEILSESGIIVSHANDGEQCVEMIQKASASYYDAVLMDIQMPNMNGYEATKAIRAMEDKAKAGIPIVAMTANAFEEDKRESIRCGMNAHIAKPIDVQELLSTLAGVV